MEEFTIRRATAEDLPFLRMMLFYAFYWDPGSERPLPEQEAKAERIQILWE